MGLSDGQVKYANIYIYTVYTQYIHTHILLFICTHVYKGSFANSDLGNLDLEIIWTKSGRD